MDSESDTSDVEHINRLKACLESDESADEVNFSGEPVASTSAKDWCIAENSSTNLSPLKSEHAKIKEAIALNKLSDQNWQQIETKLRAKLIECRQKLRRLNEEKSDEGPPIKKKPTFHYALCGKPYFKDKDFCSAPHNTDTIAMQRAEMIDYSNLGCVTGWTVKDKRKFISLLLHSTRDIKRREYKSAMSKLERNSPNLKARKKIAGLKRQIIDLDKREFKDIALPIDYDFDWDVISNKLNLRHSGKECKALWKLFLHPSLNKSSWTKMEHYMLKDIAQSHNYEDWDAIAAELNTNRSGYQCFVYYRTNLNTNNSYLRWTTEEDEYLKRLVNYYSEGKYIPWGKVASMMENRNKIQIYNRWRNSCQPKIKKGRFFPEEDQVLLTFVKKFGPDFHKAVRYIPGRTVNQLRARYTIITKQTSMVWTVNEDKKLTQLMANESSTNTYSEVAKHFPTKDRSHIRARYMTLQRWMIMNPNKDLALAPRKGARRLCHGRHANDLEAAITNLNKRLQSEVQQISKKNRLSKDSDICAIDDAIITHLINNHIFEEKVKEDDMTEQKEVKLDNMVLTKRQLNVDNLKRLLATLKSSMNKSKFMKSPYKTKYPELLDANVSEVKVRSYSKVRESSLSTSNRINIWKKNDNSAWMENHYVLPPNYATITGLKIIMAMLSMSKVTNKMCKNYSIYNLCKNKYFKEEWDLLVERFRTLFMWPLLLSNVGPQLHKMLPFDETQSVTSEDHSDNGDDNKSELQKDNSL